MHVAPTAAALLPMVDVGAQLVTLTAHRIVHRTKLSKHLHVLGLRGADGATYEAVLKRERLADGLPACCLGDAITVTGALSRKDARHPGPSRTVAAHRRLSSGLVPRRDLRRSGRWRRPRRRQLPF